MKALKVSLKVLVLSVVFSTSLGSAMASNDGEETTSTTLKKEVVPTMTTEALAENRLEAARVLVTFTVSEDSNIQVLNLASQEQPIKEYVAKIIDGKKSFADLTAGEIYQVIISFKRL